MFDISIHDPVGNLYLVTDSHLDYDSAPYGEFIDFLDSLNDVHTLICLGDLFKLWLADQRYWTHLHREVLKAFRRLSERSNNVILVAGNREFLLPRNQEQLKKSELPFSQVALEESRIEYSNLSWKCPRKNSSTSFKEASANSSKRFIGK